MSVPENGPRIVAGAGPAIVVVGFDRPVELARLLRSLSCGSYPDGEAVPLIISLDGGGSTAIRALADAFEWPHGPLRVIAHQSQLGLREHILACGDLSLEYGSVIGPHAIPFIIDEDNVVNIDEPADLNRAREISDRHERHS